MLKLGQESLHFLGKLSCEPRGFYIEILVWHGEFPKLTKVFIGDIFESDVRLEMLLSLEILEGGGTPCWFVNWNKIVCVVVCSIYSIGRKEQ